MKNVVSSRFRIEERPIDVVPSGKKGGQFYHEILATLDVIAPTKTIIMDPSEVPTSKVQYFKTYLRTMAKKYKKEYRVEVTEKNKSVYVWKR